MLASFPGPPLPRRRSSSLRRCRRLRAARRRRRPRCSRWPARVRGAGRGVGASEPAADTLLLRIAVVAAPLRTVWPPPDWHHFVACTGNVEGLKELVAAEGTDVNEKVGLAGCLCACFLSPTAALCSVVPAPRSALVGQAQVYAAAHMPRCATRCAWPAGRGGPLRAALCLGLQRD